MRKATDGDPVSGISIVVSITGACMPSHIIILADPGSRYLLPSF